MEHKLPKNVQVVFGIVDVDSDVEWKVNPNPENEHWLEIWAESENEKTKLDISVLAAKELAHTILFMCGALDLKD